MSQFDPTNDVRWQRIITTLQAVGVLLEHDVECDGFVTEEEMTDHISYGCHRGQQLIDCWVDWNGRRFIIHVRYQWQENPEQEVVLTYDSENADERGWESLRAGPVPNDGTKRTGLEVLSHLVLGAEGVYGFTDEEALQTMIQWSTLFLREQR